ncbi:hypothetical protein BDN72DRAFT_899982 [Pluteus cervinus]|uniref:Uncharacterized protein n=1 Tax=Pluteus cervinus TaxID=181527 RepID=A0ACD3ALB1_9AGAR|nr:hypothetical protein BDN72DRAFT_899982 [Pluteus cervinus]
MEKRHISFVVVVNDENGDQRSTEKKQGLVRKPTCVPAVTGQPVLIVIPHRKGTPIVEVIQQVNALFQRYVADSRICIDSLDFLVITNEMNTLNTYMVICRLACLQMPTSSVRFCLSKVSTIHPRESSASFLELLDRMKVLDKLWNSPFRCVVLE